MDIYVRVSRLPDPDSREVASELYMYPGGAALNYAVMVSTLGHEAYLTASVGKDPLGEIIIEYLRKVGVKLDYVHLSENVHTGTVIVLLDEQGLKYMIAYPGANMEIKIPRKFDAKFDLVYIVVAEPNILEEALKVLSKYRYPVSLGLRPQIAVRGIRYLAELRRLLGDEFFTLFLNRPELTYLTGTVNINEALDILKKNVVGIISREVVVTLGEEGSIILLEDNNVEKIQAVKLGQPVDTTGAGDVYAAVYNLARLQGLDAREAGELASLAAGVKVLKRGASNVPTLSELYLYASRLGKDDLLKKVAVQHEMT